MFVNLWEEVKHSCLTGWAKRIRFLTVVFVPFVFGFTYVFAFYNPWEHTNNLDLRVMVANNDPFAKDFVKTVETQKNKKIKLGNFNYKIQINHNLNNNQIYLNPNNFQKESENLSKQSFASLAISPGLTGSMEKIISYCVENLNDNIEQVLSTAINKFTSKKLLNFYINFNKNYPIGLGVSLATTLTPVYAFGLQSVFNTSPNSIISLLPENERLEATNVWKIVQTFVSSDTNVHYLLNNINVFQVFRQGKATSKFGQMSSPLFLLIAILLGSIATSLVIIPTKTKKKKWNSVYFYKGICFCFVGLVQTTVLVLSLYTLGFVLFGLNILYLLLLCAFVSVIFSWIAWSIRTIIPNRLCGILILIVFVLFQLATTGSIFSNQTLNIFYKTIGLVMPSTYALPLIQNGLFGVVWRVVANDVIVLVVISVVFTLAGYFVHRHRRQITSWKKLKRQLERHNA